MNDFTERELTRLSFLVDALVDNPQRAEVLTAIPVRHGGMSPEFAEAVEALRVEFSPLKDQPKVGRAGLEAVVGRLQQSDDKPARVAGSLLAREIDMIFGRSHRSSIG